MKNSTLIFGTLFIFLLLTNTTGSFSQIVKEKDYTVITGKIIDAKTETPVAFASVSLPGTQTGTVANTEGEFSVKFTENEKAKYLLFKYIGYKNKKIRISEIPDKDFIVKLTPSVIPIEEIIVRPDDAEELIKKITAKIPENYDTKPFKEIAFYREYVKKRNKYISVSEAVVEIYKAPYNKEFAEDMVKLYKGHKSEKIRNKDTVIMKLRGGPKTALLLDIAKNPQILFAKENLELYDFKLENITKINDKDNYIITFKQKKDPEYPLFNGKLYADVKTLAITAAEFSLNLENKTAASRLFIHKKPLFLSIIPVKTKYLVRYGENNGKFFFSHARGEVSFEVKRKRKPFKTTYSVMTEIAITDRTDKNVKKIPRSEQLKSNIVFSDKVYPFSDKDFWGKYNTIKPEESIQKTIKKYGVKLKIQEN